MSRILVTGSYGFIGAFLCQLLRGVGHDIVGLDVRLDRSHRDHGDIREPSDLSRKVAGCSGIVHLAAVSRVALGQSDPKLSWQTNVNGTRNVIESALGSPLRPWLLFASSREVYGEPISLPVRNDAPIRPINVYGRTKAEGEQLVLSARRHGLDTAILRLANVYGGTNDHPDRVVPAFCCAAAAGAPLTVRDRDSCLDFTHVSDTVQGMLMIVERIIRGSTALPPVQLATGRGTTLGELANLAVAAAGSSSPIVQAPERDFVVARFVGDPRDAGDMLGWRPEITIADGIARLVRDFGMSTIGSGEAHGTA